MTTVKNIFDYTETFAPVDTAADFDNCGVLVGDINSPVTKVLVALDITEQVVLEAKDLGCELIISHHPVIFSPLKSLKSNSVPYLLAQNGITALCLHTNLDIAQSGGVNACLANTLDLSDIRIYPESFLAIGELSNSMNPRDFALFVKSALCAESVSYTDGNKDIKTVAMCSGAGGDFCPVAEAMGADAFVTGEAKHHELIDAQSRGITMVVAGHFSTEDVVVKPLADTLCAHFPEVEFIKSAKCTNPVHFV